MPQLRVIPDGQVASSYSLSEDKVSLGRDATNSIVLRDMAASSFHAEILKTSEGWQIKDLNSKNGTFVNDVRVEARLLQRGDSILVGCTEIVFGPDGDASAAEDSISRAEYLQRILSLTSDDQVEESDLPNLVIDDVAEPEEKSNSGLLSPVDVMHTLVIPKGVEPAKEKREDESRSAVETGAEAKLRLVQRVSEKLVRIFEPKQLLDEIMTIVVDQFQADRGLLCLLDDQGNPRPIAARGIGRAERVSVSRTVLNQLLQDRTGVVLDQSNYGDARRSLEVMEVQSTMCVPLWTGDSIVGILSIDSTDRKKIFTQRQLDLLIAVAHQVAIGIERSRLSEQMEEERQLRAYLSKYLDQQIVQKISEGRGTGEDPLKPAERVVTILFSDIVSFTKMSEPLSPVELADFVSDYLTTMTEIIFQHGGTIDKYIGDAVMALFGAPVPSDDSVVEAIRAALEMIECIDTIRLPRSLKRRLRIRIGINTGSVVVGNLGSQGRREYTALGDAVNVASRLETFARPNEICIDEFTYQQTQGLFDVEEIGYIDVKNRAEPVIVYKVIGER